MEQDFSKGHSDRKLKINLYLKVCKGYNEVEEFIGRMKKLKKDSLDHISVLGKVQTYTKPILTRTTTKGIDFILVPEIGKIFVSGHLSTLLLAKIDGKALGSLEGGLVGILNGYGVSTKKSLQCLEYLKQGKHIVFAWEYVREMKEKSKALPVVKPQKD